jgi:PAS domain S-box-containing protein
MAIAVAAMSSAYKAPEPDGRADSRVPPTIRLTDITVPWRGDGGRWRSLRWRLPAFISVLVVVVLAVVVYGAYREVHESLDKLQGDRAQQASTQIAALLGRPSGESARQLQLVAQQLTAFARQPDETTAASARAAVQELNPGQTRIITVWNAAGTRLFDAPATVSGLMAPPRPSEPGVGPMRPVGDGRVFSDVSAAILDGASGARLGTLTMRSVIAVTPADALSRLIGTDARIWLGNRSGDLWTDLVKTVDGPAIDLRREGVHEFLSPTGELRIGALTHLPGTPWAVWVDFQEEATKVTATAFLWRVAQSGVVIAVVAIGVAAWFSIRLTTPLSRITAAAEALSDGDYGRRVTTDRDDEIGRLALAFNAMAVQVGNARRELEERVEARTRELNVALAALGERAVVRETYLATIVDNSADAIIGQDLDGIVTSWNKGAEQIFGFRAEEVIGSPLVRFIPNDGQDEDARIRNTIRSGERVPPFETVRRTKDGRLLDVSITASPIIDATGRVLGISRVARDITRRKQAEREVRDQRDLAQQYLDTAQVMLVSVDLDGGIALINRYGCMVLGRSADDVIGRHYSEFLPMRMRTPFQGRLGEVLAGELTLSESLLKNAAGEERLVEWRHTTRTDREGRVIGTLSSGTDMTERHRAEQALRVAEERMRFALEASGVGIWDMDYASGRLQWSAMIEKHYGFEPGTFPGTIEAYIVRMHPDDREANLKVMREAKRTGKDFTLQHRVIWPDGTVRSLTGAGRILLGDHGRPIRGVGISLDVTDQHILQAQFQQVQKMDAVGRLAGGIAHDFNNLLTAILGYCELLLEDLAPDSPIRPALSEIQKAGTRAAGLTRQLLSFSRKQIIEPKVFDLNAAVNDMRPMLERLIGENIVISVKTTAGPARILADQGQIEQVIMNLAVNARDAMPGGGALLIEIANVELDEHYAAKHLSATAGAYVALIVTDTGSGMTPDVQEHLFEPFFTTKEKGKGTGLGLATVHGIVTRSGGSIGVYSELGKGTAFKVYLPATTEDAAPSDAIQAPAEIPAPRPAHATVLIVDDAEGLRELARRILERHGYTVLTAADATEAIALFDQHADIDILLTDVIMPGTSGPDLTRALIAKRASLRVIFMSGYTDDAIGHHGVFAAGTTFLEKPFTASALAKKVGEVQRM